MKYQEDYLLQVIDDIQSGRVHFVVKKFDRLDTEMSDRWLTFCRSIINRLLSWQKSFEMQKSGANLDGSFEKTTDETYSKVFELRARHILIGTSGADVDKRLDKLEVSVSTIKSDIKRMLLQLNIPASSSEPANNTQVENSGDEKYSHVM